MENDIYSSVAQIRAFLFIRFLIQSAIAFFKHKQNILDR